MKLSTLLVVFVTVIFFSHNIYADEIYQDADGVWRNREAKKNNIAVEAITDVAGVFEAGVYSARDFMVEDLNVLKSPPPGTVNALKEYQAESEHNENMKVYKEINESKRNFEGYERFDPAKAGEIKSEWEFFNDPR